MSSIRIALIFKGACRADLIGFCEVVLELQRGSYCELWLRCLSLEDLLSTIERFLNEGLIPIEAGFPTGYRAKCYALSPNDLRVHGGGSLEVSGEVELEYYRQLSSWVGLLKFKKLSINLRSSKAWVVLAEPINTAKLFDVGLRLVKPYRIPL